MIRESIDTIYKSREGLTEYTSIDYYEEINKMCILFIELAKEYDFWTSKSCSHYRQKRNDLTNCILDIADQIEKARNNDKTEYNELLKSYTTSNPYHELRTKYKEFCFVDKNYSLRVSDFEINRAVRLLSDIFISTDRKEWIGKKFPESTYTTKDINYYDLDIKWWPKSEEEIDWYDRIVIDGRLYLNDYIFKNTYDLVNTLSHFDKFFENCVALYYCMVPLEQRTQLIDETVNILIKIYEPSGVKEFFIIECDRNTNKLKTCHKIRQNLKKRFGCDVLITTELLEQFMNTIHNSGILNADCHPYKFTMDGWEERKHRNIAWIKYILDVSFPQRRWITMKNDV